MLKGNATVYWDLPLNDKKYLKDYIDKTEFAGIALTGLIERDEMQSKGMTVNFTITTRAYQIWDIMYQVER